MWAWLAILLALTSPPAATAAAERAANQFPQPVRAGDLIGRKLIGPKESQPLLGHIEGVTRRADGTALLLVRTSSLLPWAGRVVAVPVDGVALLGEEVALLGLTSEQLAALPDAAGSPTPIPPNDQIQVGLVKPFH
jgi:hypothetical protein